MQGYLKLAVDNCSTYLTLNIHLVYIFL